MVYIKQKCSFLKNRKGLLNNNLLKIIVLIAVIIFSYYVITNSPETNESIIKSNDVADNPVISSNPTPQNTSPITSSTNNVQIDSTKVGLPSCGNDVCEPELGEEYKYCGDCPEYVVDDYNQIASCGNGVCEPDLHEVIQNCPEDCQ